jgi:hypothetical protein
LWLANCYFCQDSSGLPVPATLLRCAWLFFSSISSPSWLGCSALAAFVPQSRSHFSSKHQLLVNRSRQRSPNLSAWDRILALLMRPTRLLRPNQPSSFQTFVPCPRMQMLRFQRRVLCADFPSYAVLSFNPPVAESTAGTRSVASRSEPRKRHVTRSVPERM